MLIIYERGRKKVGIKERQNCKVIATRYEMSKPKCPHLFGVSWQTFFLITQYLRSSAVYKKAVIAPNINIFECKGTVFP